MWAAAASRARTCNSGLAPGPASSRASASVALATAGSDQIELAKPWRRALRAARSFPARDFGPVLFWALRRFAAICSGVGMLGCLVVLDWRLERRDVILFDRRDRATKRPPKRYAVVLDLPQAGIAALFGSPNQLVKGR